MTVADIGNIPLGQIERKPRRVVLQILALNDAFNFPVVAILLDGHFVHAAVGYNLPPRIPDIFGDGIL